jgi:plasmid stability protein
MPNLLIRNIPVSLHARLKAAAEKHRRSVNQETIATIEAGLRSAPQPRSINLPPPIRLKEPQLTAEATQRFIDEDIEIRGY